MTDVHRTSVRLTGYLVGQIATKALYLGGIIAATRATGPTGWGILTAALSVGFILITGVNLGLNPYLTREVAARKHPTEQLTLAASRYRLGSSIAFAVVVPTVLLTTIRDVGFLVAALVTGYLLFDSWSKYVYAVLRGASVTRYEVLGSIVEKSLFAVVALLALASARSSLAVAVVASGLVFSTLVNLALGCSGARKALAHSVIPVGRLLTSMRSQESWRHDFDHIRGATAFLFMAIFSTVYFRLDAYMLATMKGNDAAGFYGAAYRLIEGFLFAPAGILAVYTPLLVSALNKAPNEAGGHNKAEVVSKVAGLQFAVVGLVGVGLMLEHEWLINTLYGDRFTPSGRLLLWLGPAFLIMGLNYWFGGLLTSGYRQNALLKSAIVGVVVNIVLNLLLIPRYGAWGAVVATVITEGVVSLLMLVHVLRDIPFGWIARPFVSVTTLLGIVVVLPNLVVRDTFNFGARLVLGLVSAALLALILVRSDIVPNPLNRLTPDTTTL